MISAADGCPPLEVRFQNNSLYADSYFWDFDDGDFSSEAEPTHTFYESREHTVTLAAFGLSGVDTTEQRIMVYNRPVAVFDAYPRESKNLKQIFKFTNNSVGGAYYLWDFGDGSTSPDKEPSHIYEDSGTFTVTLYVWSEDNCADTLVLDNLITVRAGEGSIQIPQCLCLERIGTNRRTLDGRNHRQHRIPPGCDQCDNIQNDHLYPLGREDLRIQ